MYSLDLYEKKKTKKIMFQCKARETGNFISHPI